MNIKKYNKKCVIGKSIKLNMDELELLMKLNYDINSKKPLPDDVARKLLMYRMMKEK